MTWNLSAVTNAFGKAAKDGFDLDAAMEAVAAATASARAVLFSSAKRSAVCAKVCWWLGAAYS